MQETELRERDLTEAAGKELVPAKAKSTRLEVLDLIRAGAALWVCAFHFQDLLPSVTVLQYAAQRGSLGVNVFFVLSGFVVPFSISRKPHLRRDIGPFLLGRLGRVYLPYLSAFFVTVLLNYLASCSPGLSGESPSLSIVEFICHLSMTVDICDVRWVNPVFWTLAIECQFYVVIAVAMTLRRSVAAFLFAMLAAVSLACLKTGFALQLQWFPYFGLGFSVFYLVDQRGVVHSALLAVWCVAFVYACHGLLEVLVSVLTMCAAYTSVFHRQVGRLWRLPLRVGVISYSLYLLHIPFGGKLANLMLRFSTDPDFRLVVFIASIAFSFAAAEVHYRLIELPCHAWSRRWATYLRRRIMVDKESLNEISLGTVRGHE